MRYGLDFKRSNYRPIGFDLCRCNFGTAATNRNVSARSSKMTQATPVPSNKSLIEELAKALWEKRKSPGQLEWPRRHDFMKDEDIASARAIISRLAEIGPSEEMLSAGIDAGNDASDYEDRYVPKSVPAAFQAMLQCLVE